MALDWLLPIGIAVGKLLLRASDKADAADAVDDVQGAWFQLRGRGGRGGQAAVGNAITAQLKQRLAGVTDPNSAQDFAATASDVGELLSRLADSDEAVRVAAAHPEQFFAYAMQHGGDELRRWTSAAATPLFDQLLEAAVEEFTTLAPSSGRFVGAALTEVLRVSEVMAEDSTYIRAGIAQLLDGTTRRETSWPVVPRPAPALASAYQARMGGGEVPRTGTVVMSGPSGFGKTQIAAGVFTRSTADVRLWVSANTAEAIQVGYADAAVALALGGAQLGVERLARLLLAWLATTDHPWLIVLDDLVDPAHLRGTDTAPGWWPPNALSGLTVATTQLRGAEFSAENRLKLEIGHYTPAEALNYLTERLTPHLEELGLTPLAEANQLADDLGHHPLALAQAAAVILADGSTTHAYRAQLGRSKLSEALPDTARADGYTRTLHGTWALALDRATRQTALARPLLNLLAVLDPAGAPEDLLRTTAVGTYLTESDPHSQPPTEAGPAEVITYQQSRGALRALHHLSLTHHTPRLGPRSIRTHPVTARLTRESRTTDAGDALVIAAEAIVEIWEDRTSDLTDSLRANAAALFEHDSEHALWGDDGAHQLYNVYTERLTNARLHDLSITFMKSQIEIADVRYGHADPNTLALRGNLALHQGLQGDPRAGIAKLEEMIRERSDSQGKGDRITLTLRSELAQLQGEAGDLETAVTQYGELIPGLVGVLGERDAVTLTARHNFGYFQARMGDFAGAVATLQEVLKERLELYGPNHRHTLITRAGLTEYRFQLKGEAGLTAEDVTEQEQLTADLRRNLGEDDRTTLVNEAYLAVLRAKTGDPKTAVIELREIMRRQSNLLGRTHQDVIDTTGHLATVLGEQDDPVAAAEIFGTIITLQRSVGRDVHPDTLAALDQLRYWRLESGDERGAYDAMQDLFHLQERILGADHPDTAGTRAQIGQLRRIFELRAARSALAALSTDRATNPERRRPAGATRRKRNGGHRHKRRHR